MSKKENNESEHSVRLLENNNIEFHHVDFWSQTDHKNEKVLVEFSAWIPVNKAREMIAVLQHAVDECEKAKVIENE
jgi:hypothetical protein